MNSEKPNVLVTAVGAPPGLNALRALAETGEFRLLAVDADFRSSGLYQFGTEHALVPFAAREPEKYVEVLCEIIQKNRVDVVLPCIEEEVILLAREREAIESLGARLLLPDPKTLNRAVEKHLATEVAGSLGIPHPKSRCIAQNCSQEERREAMKEFESECAFPWIGKPTQGHGMRDVETLKSWDEAVSYGMAARADVLFQELIPGPIGSMHLVGLVYDGQKLVRRRFASRSIRTLYPSGGPATGGISLNNDFLIRQTEALLEKLGGWVGPANAEWMLDPRDQLFKFIEINPRLWGYGYLATGSGTNFPRAVVELALGKDIGADPGYRTGVTMLRSTVDLIFPECPFELNF